MYQHITIVGRLGADPEMRYLPSGSAVCNFSVATDWSKDETIWFRVSAFEKLAETCNQYLSKGKLVLVEGRVRVSAYTNREGNPAASLELRASTVRFLSSKNEEEKVEEKPVDMEDPFA